MLTRQKAKLPYSMYGRCSFPFLKQWGNSKILEMEPM